VPGNKLLKKSREHHGHSRMEIVVIPAHPCERGLWTHGATSPGKESGRAHGGGTAFKTFPRRCDLQARGHGAGTVKEGPISGKRVLRYLRRKDPPAERLIRIYLENRFPGESVFMLRGCRRGHG